MKFKKIIFVLLIIFIIFILAVFSYFVIIKKEEKQKIPKVERTELQLAHPELLIEDLVLGEGKTAKKGDTISVHYIGKLEDGTVFDSSYNRNKPFTFTLGKGQVILGWEIGLEGMKEKGKRKLTIPPQLGYGESGVRGMIPSNATIIFEIELLEIKE